MLFFLFVCFCFENFKMESNMHVPDMESRKKTMGKKKAVVTGVLACGCDFFVCETRL